MINYICYYYMVYNNKPTKNKNTKSTYQIVDFPKPTKTFGHYEAYFPKQAAMQAFQLLSNIVEEKLNEDGKFIVFVIQNKDTKKEYKYIGAKVKLENPVVKYENGINVTYHYKNVIGKYNPALDLLNRNA
jgi:hypothetical protein